MTCNRSPCTFSSRVIGRSSQSGPPATGWFTLGTIGQMALTFSGHKCQHYSDSGHSSDRPLGLNSRLGPGCYTLRRTGNPAWGGTHEIYLVQPDALAVPAGRLPREEPLGLGGYSEQALRSEERPL